MPYILWFSKKKYPTIFLAMTGVQLAKVFVVLFMVLVRCAEQAPEGRQNIPTDPAADGVHFTTNAHEFEDLKESYRGKRMEAAEYPGGATIDNRQVMFTSIPSKGIADVNQLTKTGKNQLSDVIALITADAIFTTKAGTILNPYGGTWAKEGFRVDMQGMINDKVYGYLHNLQAQKNGKRGKGTSSTYATVLVPQTADGLLKDDVVRKAFYDSMKGGAVIRLRIENKVVQNQKPGGKGQG